MQHPGADDLVEADSHIASALYRQLVNFEVLQLIFTLQFQGVLNAGRADIDPYHLSSRGSDGVFGRLRRTAARHQD